MNVITNVERWGNSHRPGFLDLFRIAFGIFITYKGLYFLTHMNELENTTASVDVWFAVTVLSHYVVFAHVLAGPLIAVGLFTRMACLLQVPVLIGAVFMVNFPKGLFSIGNNLELEISLISLVAAIVFMIFGAGRFSIDAIRRREMEAIH
jgi:putative oxidoreductase